MLLLLPLSAIWSLTAAETAGLGENFPGFHFSQSSLSGRWKAEPVGAASNADPKWTMLSNTEFMISGEQEDTTFIQLEFSQLPSHFKFTVIPKSMNDDDANSEHTELTEEDQQPFLPIPGWSVMLVLETPQEFTISNIILGSEAQTNEMSHQYNQETKSGDYEEVCSKNTDKFKFEDLNAKCWSATSPPYLTARAVSRLVVKGGYVCTGFLVHPKGLLLTNHHCINSQADADATTFEFGAEASDCKSVNGQMMYRGELVVTGGTFLGSDSKLDYSLVQLTSSDLAKFGAMNLDFGSFSIGTPIYIPQHPRGFAKVMGWYDQSSSGALTESVITAMSNPCTGAKGIKELGYMTDTDVGSSGSPVVNRQSNKVIGIHHCGGCPNQAVPMSALAFVLRPTVNSECFRDADCGGAKCSFSKLGDTGRCASVPAAAYIPTAVLTSAPAYLLNRGSPSSTGGYSSSGRANVPYTPAYVAPYVPYKAPIVYTTPLPYYTTSAPVYAQYANRPISYSSNAYSSPTYTIDSPSSSYGYSSSYSSPSSYGQSGSSYSGGQQQQQQKSGGGYIIGSGTFYGGSQASRATDYNSGYSGYSSSSQNNYNNNPYSSSYTTPASNNAPYSSSNSQKSYSSNNNNPAYSYDTPPSSYSQSAGGGYKSQSNDYKNNYGSSNYNDNNAQPYSSVYGSNNYNNDNTATQYSNNDNNYNNYYRQQYGGKTTSDYNNDYNNRNDYATPKTGYSSSSGGGQQYGNSYGSGGGQYSSSYNSGGNGYSSSSGRGYDYASPATYDYSTPSYISDKNQGNDYNYNNPSYSSQQQYNNNAGYKTSPSTYSNSNNQNQYSTSNTQYNNNDYSSGYSSNSNGYNSNSYANGNAKSQYNNYDAPYSSGKDQYGGGGYDAYSGSNDGVYKSRSQPAYSGSNYNDYYSQPSSSYSSSLYSKNTYGSNNYGGNSKSYVGYNNGVVSNQNPALTGFAGSYLQASRNDPYRDNMDAEMAKDMLKYDSSSDAKASNGV
eukprot:gb/GEZN01000883.1/.p1 GENE.gb/GEZN01000883.1/~~gb/GEZN01000883.1/.p1  ORF type:complete len:1002 (-),score=163.68 gb/GEZN01000883.1/:450-3455(-)